MPERKKKHTKKWMQYDKWLRRITLSCPKTFKNSDILQSFWLMHHVPGIIRWRDAALADLPKTLSEPTINSHLDRYVRLGAVEILDKGAQKGGYREGTGLSIQHFCESKSLNSQRRPRKSWKGLTGKSRS